MGKAAQNAAKRAASGKPEQPQHQGGYIMTKEQMNRMWKACSHDDKRKSEISVAWAAQARDLMWMTHADMGQQSVMWRDLKRQGKIQILEDNLFTRQDHLGKTWNFLIVQPTNLEECSIDPVALMEFGVAVSGYAYFFRRQESRDEVYRFVNEI
jgi:hypothetical protein